MNDQTPSRAELLAAAGLTPAELESLGISPQDLDAETLQALAVERAAEQATQEATGAIDDAAAFASPHQPASQEDVEALWAQAAQQLYDADSSAATESTAGAVRAPDTVSGAAAGSGAEIDAADSGEAAEAGGGASVTDVAEALRIFGAGGVSLDETGLSLPLNMGGAKEAPAARAVSAQELQALAAIEAELDERWGETSIEPSLDRISNLLDLLGNPQHSYPVILVAGTNGKTSTTRIIDALLQAFHRRTGRFTSPHLQQVTERIAIDGQPIALADYVRIYQEIRPFILMADDMSLAEGGPRLSKFEVLTAMAYAAFADAPVEVAVIEVGMGGRWDATNVVNAEVAVVTPIGLDHTDYLGDTIAEIAGEKAGIIKARAQEDLGGSAENVAILGQQDPAALEVLSARAIEVDAAVARFGMEFGVAESSIAVGGQNMNLQGLGGLYPDIFVPLSGPHQAQNAATALAAVEAFFGAHAGHSLDLERVRAGFAQVQSPGRLEKVRGTPAVFVDAAHNPAGATALANALEHDFDFSRLIAVVAVLGDKDAAGILSALEPQVAEVVITENTSPRALPAPELAELAREIFGEERVYVESYFPAAVEQAIELAEDTEVQSGAGVIITGSVVTAGEGRTLFGKDPA